jgi:hypothetical protein
MRTDTSKLVLLLLLVFFLALTFPAAKGEPLDDLETMSMTRPTGGFLAAIISPAQLQRLPDFKPVSGANNNFCTSRVINGKTALIVGVQKTNPFNAKRPLGGAFPPIEVTFSTGDKVNLSANKCRATNLCYYKPIYFPAGCFSSDCGFTIKVDPGNTVRETNESNNEAQGVCVG